MKKISFSLLSAVALLAMALPSQVLAIDFNMTFNSGSSTSPSFDSDGSDLIAMMSAVESYYEDIFTADWTLNVEFYYDDLDSGTLASHRNLATSGGKPTSCRIRVNDSSYWFIDSTPFNNSEYDMDITYAGDLGSPGNYYNGTVPDLLEYSHRGYSSGSEGFLHRFQQDMWSVLLHEMGHALGMTGNVASGETSDYDYDYDSDLVWGNTMSAECEATDNRYHLEAQSMMNPDNTIGYRTLPSMTDIFAIETAANWGDTTIRLERVDFYSTTANADMNDGGNWAANVVPNYDQDVWIRDGGTATLTTGNIGTNNLRIGNDTTVSTGAYRLRSDHDIYLGDSDGDGTVVINNGGELQCDITLDIKNGSEVQMQAGSLLDADQLRNNAGGSITGAGTIDIEDWFNNNGTITVTGGDLVIDSDVNPNLDGTNNVGTIYVTGGNFSCNKAPTDAIATTVQVSSGRSVTFTEGWVLGANGTLDLDGSTANTYMYGGLFNMHGTVNVTKGAELHCETRIESDATVNLTSLDEDLYLYADTTIEAGATITGSGDLRIMTGSTCTMEDGAVIDAALIVKSGIMEIESGDVADAYVTSYKFAMGFAGTLVMEADGDESCDVLHMSETAALKGTLIMDFIDGYTPADGDSFTILTYDSYSAAFQSIEWDGDFDLIPTYGANAFTLTVDYGDASTSPVPEPSTIVLLLAAACCLVFLRKRH